MLAGTQVRGRPGGSGTRPSRHGQTGDGPEPARRPRSQRKLRSRKPACSAAAELSHCSVSGGACHGQGPGTATKENCRRRTVRLR